jgi:hypothetical protein
MTQPLDLLAGLSGGFARPSVFPSGLIEVGDKSVTLDRCRLKQGQQFFEDLLASSIRSIKITRFISRNITICVHTSVYTHQLSRPSVASSRKSARCCRCDPSKPSGARRILVWFLEPCIHQLRQPIVQIPSSRIERSGIETIVNTHAGGHFAIGMVGIPPAWNRASAITTARPRRRPPTMDILPMSALPERTCQPPWAITMTAMM